MTPRQPSNLGRRLCRRIGAAGLLLWATVARGAWAAAADQQTKAQGASARTEKGLHFDFPPDWPIEERNGIVGPIPLQEYLDRKLSSLDPAKLKGIEAKMNVLEQQLNAMELRLRLLEEKNKRGLRSTDGATDASTTTPTTTTAPH